MKHQPMETAYKDGTDLSGAKVVYQHRGFISQLPVGDHVSYWEGTFDGVVGATATVQRSLADHIRRELASKWRTWDDYRLSAPN